MSHGLTLVSLSCIVLARLRIEGDVEAGEKKWLDSWKVVPTAAIRKTTDDFSMLIASTTGPNQKSKSCGHFLRGF